MRIARIHAAFAIAAIMQFLVQAHAYADYISETFALNSQFAGANVGSVIVDANNGSAAVNGLLSGQVRLTFNVNPISAYTQFGPEVGFTNVSFFTDLPLTPSQISVPTGWTTSSNAEPSSPANFSYWQAYAPSASRATPFSLLISGLGNQATLDHFVTPVQVFVPNSQEFPGPPLSIFDAYVGYPGTGVAPVWVDHLSTVNTAPEPTTFAMAIIGLVAIPLARRHRKVTRF